MIRPVLFACSLLMITPALAGDAATWSQKAPTGVRVNQHEFHSVRIEGSGCKLKARVYFDAPAEGYGDPKNKVRNVHRFKARLLFTTGEKADSFVFNNRDAGKRMIDFEYDSTGAGCWTKEEKKLTKLDVVGCRGRGCEPGEF